jgi:hypothetical protein
LIGLNLALMLAATLAPHRAVVLGLAGALVIHMRGCGGDVGVLNYLWSLRRDQVFVFDDPVTECGAFYRALTRTAP